LSDGRSVTVVQLFGGHNYSEFRLRGLTPPDFIGNTVRITIQWFPEYFAAIPDPKGRIVDWRISQACGKEDLRGSASTEQPAPEGGHVLTSTEFITGTVCRPREVYSVMIGRAGTNGTLPVSVSVVEVRVDFR
jgi:hypothetical protein